MVRPEEQVETARPEAWAAMVRPEERVAMVRPEEQVAMVRPGEQARADMSKWVGLVEVSHVLLWSSIEAVGAMSKIRPNVDSLGPRLPR